MLSLARAISAWQEIDSGCRGRRLGGRRLGRGLGGRLESTVSLVFECFWGMFVMFFTCLHCLHALWQDSGPALPPEAGRALWSSSDLRRRSLSEANSDANSARRRSFWKRNRWKFTSKVLDTNATWRVSNGQRPGAFETIDMEHARLLEWTPSKRSAPRKLRSARRRPRIFALLCFALLCFALLCFALLCFALLCFALPCLALPCLALPCLAWLGLAWLGLAWLGLAWLGLALLCFALLCLLNSIQFSILTLNAFGGRFQSCGRSLSQRTAQGEAEGFLEAAERAAEEEERAKRSKRGEEEVEISKGDREEARSAFCRGNSQKEGSTWISQYFDLGQARKRTLIEGSKKARTIFFRKIWYYCQVKKRKGWTYIKMIRS